MKQSKRASFIESVANVLVGIAVAFFTNIAIFWFLGITVSAHDNVVMVLCFTVVSLARSFVLRRVFEVLRVRGILPVILAVVISAPHVSVPYAPHEDKPKQENGCKKDECFDEHRGCFSCR